MTIATRGMTTLLCVGALVGCKTRPWVLGDATTSHGADAGPASLDASAPADANSALDAAPDLAHRDNCGVTDIQTTEVIRADLLLVQDKSGSMRDGINGQRNPPAGQSKWELMRAALVQVVTGTSSVDWGLMMFGTNLQCGAPAQPDVAVGPGNASTITKILESTSPNANTPTTATLVNALAYFAALHDGHPHYLLLATDGQPTCGAGGMRGGGADDLAAEAAVASAASAGVNTFVVGIGTATGADQTLATMALNGLEPNTTPGQPAYFPVTSTQDLVDVLEKAALKITTCSYPLGAVPPDPDLVTITGASGVIPRDTSHTDGWDFSSDGARVNFFGAACSALQSGVVQSVRAVFGCPGD